jgi:hypothetical protein
VTNIKKNHFSIPSIADKADYERSLMTAGLELPYDVNLDELIRAGGHGVVYKAGRKFDKLQVAIKVMVTGLRLVTDVHQPAHLCRVSS